LTTYGDALLLLVRLPEGDTELESGLNSNVEGTWHSIARKPLPFRTTHQANPSEPRRKHEARYELPEVLGALLEREACFAVPLRKRVGNDATFSDRISVGRAQNKDIVMRHPSISKFHAWFEMDESQTLFVSDGGSTNQTFLNGVPLQPRAAVAVEGGDSIRFGFVECVLCAPETFWECVNVEVAGHR
jgi:hypothetical protein